MKNINFGVDLGTTNSGIGKFENGKVIIYKNPVGFKETLPSVVSYRKGRILIGDKARELLKASSENVISSFKRKMGTDHTYFIPDINETKTPVELSSLILKELVNFASDEKPESVVITIPASFDTVQSNATKKAGYLAGFKEVVLLQEPIAACLAYANTQNIDIQEERKWLVYDFGGGTFDVALVKINDRELKIIDHKGNNFLGGVDLDHAVIEQLFCPQIEKEIKETGLWKNLIQGTESKYSKLYYELLYRAEEIKKELSLKDQAVLELEFEDSDTFFEMTITRQEFDAVIAPFVEESVKLTQQLIADNSILLNQIERIILVGGTTYIPLIRERLKTDFQVEIDSAIDPTTAVILGASYYAGSKMQSVEIEKKDEQASSPVVSKSLNLDLVYETNSKDEEEFLMGLLPDDFSGFYRIIRKDGGFDTGMLKCGSKFSEFLKILPKQSNLFTVMIYDEQQNLLLEKSTILINQGLYNISGQPLPNDICIELDDSFGKTFLEKIFKKNDILPLARTIYKTVSKTLVRGSGDKLIINIIEGKAGTLPSSNLTIGYIEIDSTDFETNLLKGMDIQLSFKMSESRDLSVSVSISSIDLEISEVFNPHSRKIVKEKFLADIDQAIYELDEEFKNAGNNEDQFLYYAKLKTIYDDLKKMKLAILDMGQDNITERLFQYEEQKRQSLQAYDQLVRHKAVLAEIEQYETEKKFVMRILEHASPRQKEEFDKILNSERSVLESNEKSIIRKKAEELDNLLHDIYSQTDEYYLSIFYHYRIKDVSVYKDQRKALEFFDLGDKALERRSFRELGPITNALYNLLLEKPINRFETKDGSLGIK